MRKKNITSLMIMIMLTAVFSQNVSAGFKLPDIGEVASDITSGISDAADHAGGAISDKAQQAGETDNISVGDVSDYTVGEGESVSYVFDCGNTDVYQFKYEAESDIDAVCGVYRITDAGLQRNDIWEIDSGKDHSLKLQEGRYYISSRFNSASAGTFKIDGRTKVIQLQLGGMSNTVYMEGEKLIIGDSEAYIDPTGLTAQVLYENNAEETVALSDIDQAISLLNGQKISAGLLKMDSGGQTVSAGITHYRELSEMPGAGNYAVVAIIDGEPYTESFIPITVKPVDSGNADIGITWSISDGILTVGLQNNHTSGEIPDYEYVQEAPWYSATKWYKPSKIVIEEGISSIGVNSFSDLDNISDIELPMSLQRIADDAFSDEAVYNADISYSGTQGQWDSLTQGTILNDVEITSTHIHTWDSGKVIKPATTVAAGAKILTCTGCGETETVEIPMLLTRGSTEQGLNWKVEEGVLTINVQDDAQSTEIPDYASSDDAPWLEVAKELGVSKIVVEEGITKVGSNAFIGLETVNEIDLPRSLKELKEDSIDESILSVAKINYAGSKSEWDSLTQGTALNDIEITSTHVHTWDSGKVTNEATTTAEGIMTYTCTDCGETKIEPIAKLPTPVPTITQPTVPSIPAELITISKKPTIKKPTSAKGKITVNWKHFKNTTKKGKAIWKSIKKVQVQCATDKGFANIVKTAVVGKKKTMTTIKGLAKKTTYYVRVRYYDGTGYSAWSGVKKVKTK